MRARQLSSRAPLSLLEVERRGALMPPSQVRLRVRLGAWIRRPWLDRQLLHGCDPTTSSYLELRAAELTGRDSRSRLAGALRRARDGAGRGAALDPAVPADRAEVEAALGRLIELEELLRSPSPVYCRGMVLGWGLIGDGAGPLYAPRRRGALAERLDEIVAALRGVSQR